MKKKAKYLGIIAVILSVTVCFAGCGSGASSNNPSGSTSKEKIKIEDVSWQMDEGVVDGTRYVLLNYTNNTKYTITSFKLTFKEKSGITDEEKSSFYSDMQAKFKASDEDMEKFKSRSISMRVNTDRVVNPGESASNINCYYYEGYYYVDNFNHYDLVEPDIATIKYIDEDKVYTVYYDYSSKKYSTEAETEIALQWSQTDLGNKIPKPDVKVIESDSTDSTTYFSFDAYGMSLEQFNAYVEECKRLGYTDKSYKSETSYYAYNSEGYQINLSYQKKDYKMDGTVYPPK